MYGSFSTINPAKGAPAISPALKAVMAQAYTVSDSPRPGQNPGKSYSDEVYTQDRGVGASTATPALAVVDFGPTYLVGLLVLLTLVHVTTRYSPCH